MDIRCIWQPQAKYPQFNIELAVQPGNDAFLVIKGCRIVDGQKGQFVSGPATKGNDGKYWNHTFFGPAFQEAVLKKALESKEHKKPKSSTGSGFDDMDSDIPY